MMVVAFGTEERDTVHRFRKTAKPPSPSGLLHLRRALRRHRIGSRPLAQQRAFGPRTCMPARRGRRAAACVRAFPCRHRRRFLCTAVECGGGARRKQSVPVEYRKLFVNSLACRPSAMAHASRSGNRFKIVQKLRMSSIYGGYIHSLLTQKQPVFLHRHQAPAELASPLPTQPDKIPELQK
jgi:hypothetical protein